MAWVIAIATEHQRLHACEKYVTGHCHSNRTPAAPCVWTVGLLPKQQHIIGFMLMHSLKVTQQTMNDQASNHMSLTKIKLAVELFAVDYVEAVVDVSCHVADLKVEPLVVMVGVDVWVQY